MKKYDLLKSFDSLPEEGKAQVIDFIGYLQNKYSKVNNLKKPISLDDFAFVGMWKDRPDMKNSVNWVKELRKKSWQRKSE